MSIVIKHYVLPFIFPERQNEGGGRGKITSHARGPPAPSTGRGQDRGPAEPPAHATQHRDAWATTFDFFCGVISCLSSWGDGAPGSSSRVVFDMGCLCGFLSGPKPPCWTWAPGPPRPSPRRTSGETSHQRRQAPGNLTLLLIQDRQWNVCVKYSDFLCLNNKIDTIFKWNTI